VINLTRFALNRIICPDLDLEAFFKLTSDAGLKKVELRNDLPGKGVIDKLSPAQAGELVDQHGIEIITINALQKFNLGSMRSRLLEELQQIIELAKSINCRAVVLCPNNDKSDGRDHDQIREETLENLKSFAPLFEDSGLTGLVEPLGFPESSLPSLISAMDIIRETGCSRYKVVHDTFHHHLGPDSTARLQKEFDITYTGLVHVSGVETDQPKEVYRDEHRVLVGSKDRLNSREQVQLLLRLGYTGDISYEPFSEAIQNLPADKIKSDLEASLRYLRG
jgi:2-keto-myo-inositol isomerase